MPDLETSVLEKNLECIERYNPKLKEDLMKLPHLTNSFELTETELKEPNLLYNGLPLHSQKGAELEAKRTFESAPNHPTSIQVLFGIGLGHLFKEFCENSKGKVIVYEPNLEILRVTLELVDFSKELIQPNIFVTSDITTFKNLFMVNYTYNANASFSILSSYKNLYEKELPEIFSQLEVITGICMAQFNTLKKSVALSANAMLTNFSKTLNETPLAKIKDTYKGQTAIIVSAGPSLDLNIETIKKNRNKVVIFCVGTALKSLIKNGITPDFLNIMEVNDVSGQFKDCDLSGINMILEPYTHNAVHQAKTKHKFVFPSNSSHANQCWSELTGIDISEYDAKGTVSYEAATCAKILGFTKIILVGQDLAYVNNQCYSKDSAYSELTYEINPETNKPEFAVKNEDKYLDALKPKKLACEENEYRYFAGYKIKNLNDTLYYVKGITGEMLPTQGGYATFIEHFRGFASENKHLDLINTSMIGAQIDGFKNIPLEVALFDVKEIEETTNITSIPFAYDKEKICDNIDREYNLLKNCVKDFEKAQEYIYKYEREFKRSQTTTEETGRYFKLLLGLYSEMCIKYGTKSQLYNAIIFTEDIEIQYLLKSTETVDVKSILNVYDRLKNFYGMAGQKLVEATKSMDKLKESMVESANTKS